MTVGDARSTFSDHGDRRPRPKSGPRLMVLLLGLAVLPMIGVGWLVVDEYDEVRRAGAVSDEIQRWTAHLRELDEFRRAITEEGNTRTAIIGIENLGIASDRVTALVGYDVARELEETIERVDDLLVDAAGSTYRDRVVAVRRVAPDDMVTIREAYDAIAGDAEAESLQVRQTLTDVASEIPDGRRVTVGVQLAEAATVVRLEFGELLGAFYRTEFSAILRTEPDYETMVELRADVLDAVDDLRRLAPEGSDTVRILDELMALPATTGFLDAVDVAIADVLGSGDRTDVGVLDEGTTSTIGLRDGVTATDHTLELVESATADLRRAAADVADDASAEFRRTIILLVTLALASIGIALLLARYVGRPMVRLGEAASALGTGAEIDVARRGPAEVRQVGDALMTAAAGLALVERLEHQATHDDLTGIPSRRLVRQRLEQAIARTTRAGTEGALLFVDLDDFKTINDTYGHPAGDEVLRVIAQRIGTTLRLEDEVGRYGGDEFLVVAESADSADGAIGLAERTIEVVRERIDISHVSEGSPASGVRVSASIGVALFGGGEESSGDVIRRADAAAYTAKTAGRNCAVLAADAESSVGEDTASGTGRSAFAAAGDTS